MYSRKPSKPQEIPAFLILFCGEVLRGVCVKDEQGCPSPRGTRGCDALELNRALFPGEPNQLLLFPSKKKKKTNSEFIYDEKVLISHFFLKEKVTSSCCSLAAKPCVKYCALRARDLILILRHVCSADLAGFESYWCLGSCAFSAGSWLLGRGRKV